MKEILQKETPKEDVAKVVDKVPAASQKDAEAINKPGKKFMDEKSKKIPEAVTEPVEKLEGVITYRSLEAGLMLPLGPSTTKQLGGGRTMQEIGLTAVFKNCALVLDLDDPVKGPENRKKVEILELHPRKNHDFHRVIATDATKTVEGKVSRKIQIRKMGDEELRSKFTIDQLRNLGFGDNPGRIELEVAAEELGIDLNPE